MGLIVYADVLVAVNLLVNYFLLMLTGKLCKAGYSLKRCMLGSFVGALFSLYIFLPGVPFTVEMLAKLIFSALIVLICFGFENIKSFFRNIAVFYGITFLYGGFMLSVWYIFKPNSLTINNGVVYFDISPLVLIVSSSLCYIIFTLARRLTKKHAQLGKRCGVSIFFGDKCVEVTALIDSGNSLKDTFSDRPVIIIDEYIADSLLGFVPMEEKVLTKGNDLKGFRLIPYRAVGGRGLLPAFVCEKIIIENKTLHGVLAAVSREACGDGYKAIINPDIL